MTCPKCGNQFEGNFCNQCGYQVRSEQVVEEKNKPKVCIQCQTTYTGEFCPNGCNNPFVIMKNRKKKRNAIILGVVAAFVVFAVVYVATDGFGMGLETESTSSQSVQAGGTAQGQDEEAPAIAVTAEKLCEEAEANAIAAEEKYKDKLVEVTGTVKSIGKDILDQSYITLSSGDQYSIISVQCYFTDKNEISKVAQLKEGDEVTVIGTVDDFTLNVGVKKCKIK